MFLVSQHNRDLDLIESFMNFFKCGQIKKDSRVLNSGVYYYVKDIKSILEKIIPFFEQYPIIGNKYLDYLDFLKIALLIKEKAHLTPEGLEEVRKIKAGMNSSRIEEKLSPTSPE